MTEVRCTRCGDKDGPWGRVDGKLVCERCVPAKTCIICKGHGELLMQTMEPDSEWSVIPCICTGKGPLTQARERVA